MARHPNPPMSAEQRREYNKRKCRAYWNKNREMLLYKQNKRRAAKRKEYVQYYKEYYLKNRDKILARQKEKRRLKLLFAEKLRWDITNEYTLTVKLEYSKICLGCPLVLNCKGSLHGMRKKDCPLKPVEKKICGTCKHEGGVNDSEICITCTHACNNCQENWEPKDDN